VASSLNKTLVSERLSQIRSSANRMHDLVAIGKTNFLANPDNFAIAEHHLRRSLEAILDIGRHIIAKRAWGAPNDYRSILLTLGQRQVIPPVFVEKIQGMAGYRNRLVHAYADVSPEEIYDLLSRHLEDFAKFSTLILHFLEQDK